VKAVRDAGLGHGPGTVAKALADLTAAGALVNPRDGLPAARVGPAASHTIPGWVRGPAGNLGPAVRLVQPFATGLPTASH